MPQNQIPLQANQINITKNPVRNNTYIERYPQMKFVQDPKYQIHANFRPEVTEIATRLAEAVREAVWDCQRSSTYTQEAFESNMKKHLESVPKVTVVSYGVIQKIDQFGNQWADWMDSEESYELLQQSLLKIPLKQGTANVQYVPLETEEETEEQEEEKPWWERAWDSIKETASDVWDTVTSKEFREKALAIGGSILVATAGAAGPAMGVVVTYLGGSVAMAGAATTATTVGGYVIAGAVVADAVNTSAEVVTGTNYIAKGAYELFGNENWTEEDFLNLYGEGKELLYMGAYAYAEFGANAMAAGYSSQKSVGDTKAATLSRNRMQGKTYEQQEFANFSRQNSNAVEQITIKTESGVRTRVDAIGIDSNKNVVINEFKSSATAPLTNNQKIAFPEIMESGGVVVGKGKGIFTGGYQIPAGTQIKIIRPQ